MMYAVRVLWILVAFGVTLLVVCCSNSIPIVIVMLISILIPITPAHLSLGVQIIVLKTAMRPMLSVPA